MYFLVVTVLNRLIISGNEINRDVGAGPRGCPPQTIELLQNFPNPFNPTTTIEFRLSHSREIMLAVYIIRGQQVAVLGDGMYTSGLHSVTFDGHTHPSGIYLCQLTTTDNYVSRKMMLIR